MMTPRERLQAVLHFEKPDRIPYIEWAPWWDKTFARWQSEGLDLPWDIDRSLDYFGLENLVCLSVMPQIPRYDHEGEAVRNIGDYEALKKNGLFSDQWVTDFIDSVKRYKARHEKGELSIRIWLDGFFWFPRRLLGIEPHLYSFYDEPELLHQINADLCAFNSKAIRALYEVDTPDFIGFAEDMSYNHGPMLSKEHFDEFLLPYYRQIIPVIKEKAVPVLTDSDGDITRMIPWLYEAGIEGVYPLERQAGVDIVKLRALYPNFLMLGGYDKMVMSKGEEAMRGEFERILPVIRSGGYLPSVDHQTPPEVSLENYRIYLKLFREYIQKAVE